MESQWLLARLPRVGSDAGSRGDMRWRAWLRSSWEPQPIPLAPCGQQNRLREITRFHSRRARTQFGFEEDDCTFGGRVVMGHRLKTSRSEGQLGRLRHD